MTMDQLGIVTFIFLIIQGAISIWLKSKIENAVKHHTDRKLEEFKYEMHQREQAAMIAELIAEWNSQPKDRKRLNQLTMEANLWLPEELARELNKILSWDPTAKSPKELLVQIRHLIRGKSDNLQAGEIVHFKNAAT